MNGKFCASLSFRSHSTFPPPQHRSLPPTITMTALLSCAKNITITYSAAKCKQRQRCGHAHCRLCKLRHKVANENCWLATHTTHTNTHHTNTTRHTCTHSCGNKMRHRGQSQLSDMRVAAIEKFSWLSIALEKWKWNGKWKCYAAALPCPALPYNTAALLTSALAIYLPHRVYSENARKFTYILFVIFFIYFYYFLFLLN